MPRFGCGKIRARPTRSSKTSTSVPRFGLRRAERSGAVETVASHHAPLEDHGFDHADPVAGQEPAELGSERTEGTGLDLDELAARLHGVDAESLDGHLATPARGESVPILERAVEARLHPVPP